MQYEHDLRAVVVKEARDFGKNMEKVEPLDIASGNVKWYNYCGK